MRIPIDRNSTTPLYRQIASYLRENILSQTLPPETRLPASRALASDLGVNRLTVETAYAGLEAEGLVFSRAGSGTYVASPVQPATARPAASAPPCPGWQQRLRLHPRLEQAPNPAVLLQCSGHGNPIDLSDGTGAPAQFPAQEFGKFVQQVMRRKEQNAFGYGDPRGYAPLRETIAQVVASQGLGLRGENILITSGSQQGISLACHVILQPGDCVLVEEPTYSGALDLFHAYRAAVIGIPMDEQGMKVEALESLLRRHQPRMIYSVPTFQNPSGTSLSAARRHQLVALASRYDVPIVEDDFVGDLRYEGRAQPALKAFDPGGQVIYVSTFSKMLMPGLRVGFLAAEGPVYERLVTAKHAIDMASSSLIQQALDAYVTIGRYQAFLRRSCRRYRQRRDAMLRAIQNHLPETVTFTPPQGGLFVWLRLPQGVSSEVLLPRACREGMAFMPGTRFFPDPSDGEAYLRLSFAGQPMERIGEAIRRLGQALSST
ncbi:MAG: PLP-dependent aminotransferase family protein [Chloroflexota bacterium]